MNGLDDVYIAIFMPSAEGKSNDTVLIVRNTGSTAYRQNKGLDTNSDGKITKGEQHPWCVASLIMDVGPSFLVKVYTL